MTPEMIERLKGCFMLSLTDDEACLACDLSPSTFYDYCSKNKDFAELKERLKKHPNIKAKTNWIKKINEEDYAASKEWLECKAKDEFSKRTETKNEIDIKENPLL